MCCEDDDRSCYLQKSDLVASLAMSKLARENLTQRSKWMVLAANRSNKSKTNTTTTSTSRHLCLYCNLQLATCNINRYKHDSYFSISHKLYKWIKFHETRCCRQVLLQELFFWGFFLAPVATKWPQSTPMIDWCLHGSNVRELALFGWFVGAVNKWQNGLLIWDFALVLKANVAAYI